MLFLLLPAQGLSPARPPSPGVDTTDWNQSIHVSGVLLVALGPSPCPRPLLGVVGKAEVVSRFEGIRGPSLLCAMINGFLGDLGWGVMELLSSALGQAPGCFKIYSLHLTPHHHFLRWTELEGRVVQW